MGSFGPKGGPPCERCQQLPSVYHSDRFGLMCNRCLQEDDNVHWAAYWGRKYRTDRQALDRLVLSTLGLSGPLYTHMYTT